MLCFLHQISEALDSSFQTNVIYVELFKAFDTVSHSCSLHKLDAAGAKGALLSWFQDYLTNRTQCVLILVKEAISNLLPVTSGVPQDTILGPMLFLTYINDLSNKLSKETLIYLFADDTKLAQIIYSPLVFTKF